MARFYETCQTGHDEQCWHRGTSVAQYPTSYPQISHRDYGMSISEDVTRV